MCKQAPISNQQSGKSGFSLIETLVALAIFSIGMLAVTAMLTNSSMLNGNSRAYTEAAAFASDQIEALMAADWDATELDDTDGDGAAGLGDVLGNADFQQTNGIYTICWNIAENDMTTRSKTIEVIVVHNRDGQQAFSVETVRSDFFP